MHVRVCHNDGLEEAILTYIILIHCLPNGRMHLFDAKEEADFVLAIAAPEFALHGFLQRLRGIRLLPPMVILLWGAQRFYCSVKKSE